MAPRLLLACIGVVALACLHPAPAAAASSDRDRVAALRVSVRWITQYEPRFWVAVETPGPCAARPGGRRRCPIAIVIKAWVGTALVSYRCTAEAVLTRRGGRRRPSRTSARCTPVT